MAQYLLSTFEVEGEVPGAPQAPEEMVASWVLPCPVWFSIYDQVCCQTVARQGDRETPRTQLVALGPEQVDEWRGDGDAPSAAHSHLGDGPIVLLGRGCGQGR